ncbi:MAG: hypothetical protein ACQER2_06950 [Bacillota bacterium]
MEKQSSTKQKRTAWILSIFGILKWLQPYLPKVIADNMVGIVVTSVLFSLGLYGLFYREKDKNSTVKQDD